MQNSQEVNNLFLELGGCLAALRRHPGGTSLNRLCHDDLSQLADHLSVLGEGTETSLHSRCAVTIRRIADRAKSQDACPVLMETALDLARLALQRDGDSISKADGLLACMERFINDTETRGTVRPASPRTCFEKAVRPDH